MFAQLTVPTGTIVSGQVNAQGRSFGVGADTDCKTPRKPFSKGCMPWDDDGAVRPTGDAVEMRFSSVSGASGPPPPLSHSSQAFTPLTPPTLTVTDGLFGNAPPSTYVTF